MTAVGEARAATIATGEPRFLAILSTLVAGGLAGIWVKDGPQWVRHVPKAAVITYLVAVAVVLVWGCTRGWRIALPSTRTG